MIDTLADVYPGNLEMIVRKDHSECVYKVRLTQEIVDKILVLLIKNKLVVSFSHMV